MFRLTTFGGLSLASDGVPVTGAAAQRSRLALLALLASSGTAGVSRDKLLAYLWPESDSERARHALKQAVYSIRRDLGSDEAIMGTATLCLNPAIVTSDLADFIEAARTGNDEAISALYAGPFLDGAYVKDAPEFERWAAEERARLAHIWNGAVDRLASRAETTGDWHTAIAFRRQLAASEPMGGRVTLALMRALAESGDVAAAIQQFRVHETLLREELDAEPEPDVAALAEALRSGTWQRSAPVVPPAPAPPSPAPVPQDARATEPPPPSDRRPSRETNAPRRRREPGAVAAVILILVAAAGAFAYTRMRDDPATQGLLSRAPARITPGLHVVAPLENLTGDSTLSAFGDLAAETVIEALHRANVDVVPAKTASLTSRMLQSMPSTSRPHERGLAVAREYGASTAVVGSYYKNGDTIRVTLQFIDMATKREVLPVAPIVGVVKGTMGSIPLAERVGRAALARTAQASDTTAEGRTLALVPASSYEAYTYVTRAYGRFFQDPADTAAVFSLLAQALALDPEYIAPLLVRAYVLDVKRIWPAAEETVRKIRPHAARLNAVEREWLELYESDLRGDLYGRLRAARRIMQLSPKSTEMALLVVLSALYVGKPTEALAALATSDPDRGINLVSPVYWMWRTEAEHEAEDYAAEARSAKSGIERFASATPTIQAMVRVLSTAGPTRMPELRSLLERGVPNDSNPQAASAELRVIAARELRRHGHAAVGDSILRAVADQQKGVPRGASGVDHRLHASVLYDLGRYAEARAILDGLLHDDPLDVAAKGRLGAIAIRMGDRARATQIDAELAAVKTPYLAGDATKWRAQIAAADGRIDEAVALLRVAVRRGHRLMDLANDVVHLDRDFAELGASNAYRQLKTELARAPVP